MRALRTWPGAAWAVAAGMLAAAASRGQNFNAPRAGVRLFPGAIESVRWTPPSDAEEMELLLSLDGGRTFAIRVTGDLDGDASFFAWRVPSLRSDHARLGLRSGSGTEASESIRALSEEFEIAGDVTDEPEPLLRVGGELRTRDALLGPEQGIPISSGFASEPSLRPLPLSESASLRTRLDPGADVPSRSRYETESGAALVSPAARIPRWIRVAPLPLRE